MDSLLRHPWGIGRKPAVARGEVVLDSRGRGLRLSLPDRPALPLDEREAGEWLAGRHLAAIAVDGRAVGVWRADRSRRRPRLDLTWFAAPADRPAPELLDAARERVLAMLAADA